MIMREIWRRCVLQCVFGGRGCVWFVCVCFALYMGVLGVFRGIGNVCGPWRLPNVEHSLCNGLTQKYYAVLEADIVTPRHPFFYHSVTHYTCREPLAADPHAAPGFGSQAVRV